MHSAAIVDMGRCPPGCHSVLLPGGSPEDGYVVVYVGWASLGHALGYPDHVACLLFTQTHVRVEHAHVELADESQLHQLTLHTHTQGICRQQISTPGPVFPPVSHLDYVRLEDGYVGVGVHNPNGISIGSSAFVWPRRPRHISNNMPHLVSTASPAYPGCPGKEAVKIKLERRHPIHL